MNDSALAFFVRAFYSEKNKTFQLILPTERKKAKKKRIAEEENTRELMHTT